MKRLKKALKPVRRRFHRYVNGTKGVISIFLALVMSPLLSISLLLVESARYQSAVQMMEEIMDCAGFSTLSEYDSYVDKRFGLMAVSQDLDIDSTFSKYLNENAASIGGSVTVNSVSAHGVYALSDAEVFRQQVLEEGEFSVPSKILIDGINLKDKFDELMKGKGKTEEFANGLKAVKDGADATKYVTDAVKALQDSLDKYNEYKDALTKYQTAYDDPNSDNDMVFGIGEIIKYDQEHYDAIDHIDYSNNTIYYKADADMDACRYNLSDYAWHNMNEVYKVNYKNSASDLKTKLKAFQTSVTGANGSLAKVKDAIDKLRSFAASLDKAAKLGESTFHTIISALEEAEKVLNNSISGDFDGKANADVTALETQIQKLNDMKASNFLPGSASIDKDSTQESVRTEYGPITMTTPGDFGAIIAGVIENLNTCADNQAGADQIEAYTSMMNSIFGMTGLYDSNLDAMVNVSNMLQDTGVDDITVSIAMESMKTLVSSIEDYQSALVSHSFCKLLKSAGKLIVSVVEFVVALSTCVLKLTINLAQVAAELVSNPQGFYERTLLCGYAAYNFPNRTSYLDVKGQNLAGTAKFRDLYQMAGGTMTSPGLVGSFSKLQDIKSDEGGSDSMFKGAEAEYLMIGTKSEIQNQCGAFFKLYVMRFMLDFIPVMNDKEVGALKEIPYVGIVLFIIVLLLEPLVDTLLLVNSGREGRIPFFKNYVYVAASGFPYLLEKLKKVGNAGMVQEAISNAIGKSGEKVSTFTVELTYTEHLLFLLMLAPDPDTLVQRMQNVVQMEGKTNYKGSFTLDNAYTYVNSEVGYSLNPMLKLDSLTKNGLFKFTKVRYSGY